MNVEFKDNHKVRVARNSVIASFFLTGGKLTVGVLTGSLGILSEAAHSALDLAAALITFFAVKVSDKPADDEHHYGHARIENLSAMVESVLLLLTCFWIIREAIVRLLYQDVSVEINIWSFLIIIVSIIVDYSRSRALSRAAKEYNSQALEADALHFFSDIFSSVVVLAGLVFARFGLEQADPAAALIVAVIVIAASLRLAKKTVDALLDRAPEGLDKEITEQILKMPGVAGVHKVRLRQSGGSIQGDLHIVMERDISFTVGHKIASEVEERLAKFNSDIVVHFEPGVDWKELHDKAQQTKETIAAVLDENSAEFKSYHKIDVVEGQKGTVITVNIVLPKGMSVEEAGARCTGLERKIHNRLPGVIVHFCIEPCDNQCSGCGDKCSPE